MHACAAPLWFSSFPRQWHDWLKEVQLQILMGELEGTWPWSSWPPAFHLSIQEARIAQRRDSAAWLPANLHTSTPPHFCSSSSCSLLERWPSPHSTNSAIIALCNLAETIMPLFNMLRLRTSSLLYVGSPICVCCEVGFPPRRSPITDQNFLLTGNLKVFRFV